MDDSRRVLRAIRKSKLLADIDKHIGIELDYMTRCASLINEREATGAFNEIMIPVIQNSCLNTLLNWYLQILKL